MMLIPIMVLSAHNCKPMERGGAGVLEKTRGRGEEKKRKRRREEKGEERSGGITCLCLIKCSVKFQHVQVLKPGQIFNLDN